MCVFVCVRARTCVCVSEREKETNEHTNTHTQTIQTVIATSTSQQWNLWVEDEVVVRLKTRQQRERVEITCFVPQMQSDRCALNPMDVRGHPNVQRPAFHHQRKSKIRYGNPTTTTSDVRTLTLTHSHTHTHTHTHSPPPHTHSLSHCFPLHFTAGCRPD